MHLKQDFNIPDFLSAVKGCDGEVFFNTPEGDSLALRSSFCQYIFCSLFETSDTFYEAQLVFEKDSDKEKLLKFIEG
ncbi:MAG: hypothetical protein IJO60_09140 [Agathobacter sp.]|nr:hypothetical protein [Agathobacter sp.]